MRNKFSRKKDNHWQIMVIFAMLLLMVCYACQDEIWDALDEEHKTQAIEDAKAWYEANRPEEIRLRSSGKEDAISVKAEWSQAFATENDKFKVVETNLMAQKMFMYIDNDCMEKYKETNDPKYRQCYTRMVFQTDRKTNETVGFLMTVVPNLDWLEKSNFKPFKKVTYLYRSKHFGGMILFHDMEGNFVDGWKYTKGEIVGRVGSPDFDGSPDTDPDKISLRAISCYNEPVFGIFRICTDWFTQVEDLEPHYSGTTCNLHTELIGHIQICYDNGGSSSNPGGYPPPSTGGGSAPGGTQTPSSVAPKATKMFRNSNMTLENWKILEAMLNKMITQDCMGQELYNKLDESLNGKTLTIQFVDQPASSFSFDGTTAGISLSNSMESNVLYHEMFHAYQAYQETTVSHKASSLNREVEARYAQYLYISKLPEYKDSNYISKWEEWYNNQPLDRSVKNLKKYVDSKGNIMQGETNDRLDIYVQNEVVSRLKGISSYEDKEYDYARYGTDNFKNIRVLTKDC